MKKLIALLLCLVMLLGIMTGCDPSTEKGNNIPIYLATEISNFDPAYANLDDASAQVLGLIYEGLFRINKDGKVEKAGADSVKVLDNESNNYYAIEITLKNNAWSDGISVQAADYIYAWKRILEPEYRGEAASLLFDIKNARAVNSGDVSIDDLGVSDVATNIIKIEFERKINYDKFYENLASIALSPLRENVVGKVEKDWSSNPTVLVTNGPFMVRSYSKGEELILERNATYMRDLKSDDLNEYVKPYRLAIDLSMDASEAYEAYKNGKIAYIGEIPLDKRAEASSDKNFKTQDALSVMSVMFNTKKAPFDKAEVRRALSLVLDRQAIAEKLVFAKPAEGIIADGVFNTQYGKKAQTFRAAGGSLISASANESEARQLLSSVGVSSGDIMLTVRKGNEADLAVAQYVESAWEKLGFKVEIEQLSARDYKNKDQYDLVQDRYLDKYDSGDFDVMLFDNNMLTTDAFGNLAMYARAFASGKMNMDISADSDDYELSPHISGYYSEAYDAKLEQAFAETDLNKRAEILHSAEQLLIQDMPVIPIVQLQRAYLATEDIEGLSVSKLGYTLFANAELENADSYNKEEETAAAQ